MAKLAAQIEVLSVESANPLSVFVGIMRKFDNTPVNAQGYLLLSKYIKFKNIFLGKVAIELAFWGFHNHVINIGNTKPHYGLIYNLFKKELTVL